MLMESLALEAVEQPLREEWEGSTSQKRSICSEPQILEEFLRQVLILEQLLLVPVELERG